MKRSDALADLSRNHHQTLVVAMGMRRATEETASEVQAGFLTHWDDHARTHFRQEEEILLPAYARYGDPFHSLVARTLCEHVQIRGAAEELRSCDPPSVEALYELGELLTAHVRGEERELFVLIEEAMPAPAMDALVTALALA